MVLHLKTLISKDPGLTLKDILPKAFAVVKSNSKLSFQQSIEDISAAYDEALDNISSFDSELFEELRGEFTKCKNDDNLNSFKLEGVHSNMKLRN